MSKRVSTKATGRKGASAGGRKVLYYEGDEAALAARAGAVRDLGDLAALGRAGALIASGMELPRRYDQKAGAIGHAFAALVLECEDVALRLAAAEWKPARRRRAS